VRVSDAGELRFVTAGPLAADLRTQYGLDAGAGSGILNIWDTGERPMSGVCAAVDVHYLSTGGARAAAVLAADAAFAHVLAEHTAAVSRVPAYRPGEFYLRELPPLRAVLANLSGLGLLVVDGYADLDPAGRPGLGAHAHAEFGIPVIGVAKSRFRTATHAVPVMRGSSVRPLFVTAAGIPAADAADLVRHMAGRYRLPDVLRRADTLARTGVPAATITDRQPD
jgi:deoxyribonuclease V